MFNTLSEIMEDVELVHRVIKSAVTAEELNEISKQEDDTVISFELRIAHSRREMEKPENQEKYDKLKKDEKRIKPM